jgi:hypothetical protein
MAAAVKPIGETCLRCPSMRIHDRDVLVQDWPGPMVRLRAIPLIADLKDLDLHPNAPHKWSCGTQLSALSLGSK